MQIRSLIANASLGLGLALTAPMAWAQDGIEGLEVVGAPKPAGIAFQPAVTELAEDIHWLDSFILVIITVIVIFVTALLAYAMFKFSQKRNSTPATFTHNQKIEVAWTLIPILILIVIGSFSLPILFKQLEVPEAEVNIKVTGYKWAWSYEYPDNDVVFDAFMLGLGAAEMNDDVRAELAEYGYDEQYWKLATDNAVVVPVNRIVRVQVTASDVIHSWKVPAFGVHIDAVPGRLNETWFMAEREGVYFGQCSELCGLNHAYMPITVKVVSDEQYAQWVESQGGTLAAGFLNDSTVQVAQAE